jgi:hypothetical protein
MEHREQILNLKQRGGTKWGEIDLTPNTIDKYTLDIGYNYSFNRDKELEFYIDSITFRFDEKRKITIKSEDLDKETYDYLEMLIQGNIDEETLFNLWFENEM